MAKAIDLPITGLESDKSWERYKGSRVREYLQKKIGAFYRPDKRQADNAYHLLGFETEDTKADWLKRWKAAEDAGDDDAMAALWTDKLIIQDTSFGGKADVQNSVGLYAGNTPASLVSIDGNLKLKLRFTSVEHNPITQETKDTGESATVKIERRASLNDNWIAVTTATIPSISIEDVNSYADVDLSNVLPNGTWQLRCTAKGQVTGMTASSVQYSNVIKTKLSLSFATQWWVPNTTDSVTLSYYINGSVAKTLNYEISDKNGTVETRGSIPIGSSIYIENTRDITISGLTHGVHNVKTWLTIDGTTVKSDAVNAQIIVATDHNNKNILVAVSDVAASITSYVQSNIFKFAVYNPNADTTKVRFDITNSTKTETYASSTENCKNSSKIDYQNTLEIESSDKTLDAYIHIYDDNNNELVSAIKFNVDNSKNFAPTENADFILNPKARSNSEEHPDTIINAANGNVVNATFNNFGFVSDGWTSDKNGIKCLRVPSGTSVDIDYEPFSAFTNNGNNTASMTMEFDIATRNIVNEDVPILNVCSYDAKNNNPIGFELKPLEACFMTTNLQNRRDQDIMFQDEVKTHIAVNIVYNLASSGINYIRIFINGVINREIEYSTSDSFLQNVNGVLTSQGIRIGANGADIDIYGIRVYKRAISASQIRQDYVASLSKTEEKIAFRNANDILGDGNLIDYSKTFDKYNTILWTGTLPSYANKQNTRGDVKIHIIGDPAHSGEMKNVETKGQGTSSKGYWKWNQQFKTSYVDKDGNEVKTDWIDENGVSHGAVYQLADGLPLATKLVWKLNWASSQQSHKLGSVNLFTDLWRKVIGGNGITNYTDVDGNKPYANCRVSTIQKPFMLFTRATEDSEPIFYGLVTFGPGKADKPTFGYYKKVLPDMCMLEGSDNGVPLAEHRVPWMLDEVTYNEDEEAYQYNGENQFDFDMGNQDMVEKYFVPAFNFVFLHNLNITYFTGTYEDLVASNKTNKVKQYWVTAESTDGSHHKFDLFRWDYITNTWVNASISKTSNVYDALNLNTQIGTYTAGDNWDAINNTFITWRKNDFKSHIGDYFNVNDLMYCMQFLKLIGASDNRCKNTYLYIDPVTHKICFMQDDMDTILATDNVGRKNKPYYVEEHDLDASGNHYWNGSDNVLYNTIEATFSDELRATMNSILTGMATLGGGSVASCMNKYYFSVQKYFPAVAYNETARLLYEKAAVHYNDGSYTPSTAPLSQSLGDQLQAELEWWKRREVYISSYAKYGAFSVKDGTVGDTSGSGALVFRSITDTDGNTPNYQFTVVPSIWLYPSFAKGTTEYDGNTRVKAGDSFVSSIISADGNTNIYIRGINYFKSIGTFGDKPVAEQFNLAAAKLIEFDASTPTNKAQQFRPTQISITTPLMTNLNLEGVSTVVGAIDLSSLTKLRVANLKGTGATSVKIPQSKTIETITLPAVTDIELAEVPRLSRFTIDSVNNLKSIIIGNNVGSGFDIVTLLSSCVSSNIKLNKLVIHNVNITNLDHTIVEYIADIPEVSITGSIKVNGDLTQDTVFKLRNKFGNIDDKSNPLYIDYAKHNVTSATIVSSKYFDKVGTYKLSYTFNPANGNTITNAVWSINDNSFATIDVNTGEVTVTSIGNRDDKPKVTVTLTLNLINGSTVIASKDVYVYDHAAQLGDIVFADGTYSDELDPNKTPIGICFYISDNLRLMCGLNNLTKQCWGLCNTGNDSIANITLADSTENVYDTPLTNFKLAGIQDDNYEWHRYLTNKTYLDANGEFKEIDSDKAAGQLGLMELTEDNYNKYSSYLKELGYSSGDYIPYGLYNTIIIIAHRDVILKDSNINLEVPKATNDKSEATILDELLTKIVADHNNEDKYKQYYYPAASECYAYQPTVKDGEILLDKFKAHHWWLPSLGELARIGYYSITTYNGFKLTNGHDTIFFKAYNSGIFEYFGRNKDTYFYTLSSTEVSADKTWIFEFNNGGIYGTDVNLMYKDMIAIVRPICAF